jgi:hypothetical protein
MSNAELTQVMGKQEGEHGLSAIGWSGE